MIDRITIEWRFVEGVPILEPGHLYLVARSEGQTDGEGVVISGGPSLPVGEGGNPITGEYGFLEINESLGAGSSLSSSIDRYDPDDTEASRGALDITDVLLENNNVSLDDIWSLMVELANNIDSQEFRYDPTLGAPPIGSGLNSNSLITSVLSQVGVNIEDVRPTGNILPGDQTLLSGSGDDFLRGFDNSDVFFNAGGGNDIFHGGDGEVLQRSITSDGIDTVFYDGVDNVSINTAPDLTSWNVEQRLGGEEFLDTLFSIEAFGSRNFSILNEVNLENNDQGVRLDDQEGSEAQQLISSVGNDIVDTVTIDLGAEQSALFGNFGSFIGTQFSDEFVLNSFFGRSFDGNGGLDTVDYSGFQSSLGLTVDLDCSTNASALVRIERETASVHQI